MKIKLKLFVSLFILICIGLVSGPVQSVTVASGTSTGRTAEGVSYLYGSFKDWEDNQTLVTSVGVYKIDLSVMLVDKVGTRAGKRDTVDGSKINVRLKFLHKKLQQVVIY